MIKKIHFITDMHGHYNETIQALKEVEYDENNKNHLLVCLGDVMDRGTQSKELLEWLYRLDKESKAIVLGGNHAKFLKDYLSGSSYSPFNYIHNGVDETFASLLGRTKPFESWCLVEKNINKPTNGDFVNWLDIVVKEINEEYPWLLPWLKSLPKYFESKNYIGVHGAIDVNVEDWHYPKKELYNLKGWNALDFDDGSFICSQNPTNKTIVVGHYYTGTLREKWQIDSKDENDSSILSTKDNKIFLDTCTIRTKKVNVLVVEDELLEKDGK